MELQEQVDAHLSRIGVGRLLVATHSTRLELAAPGAGVDFVFGAAGDAIVLVPLAQIRCISGATPPQPQPITLSDFLAAQKVPVKIQYRIGGEVFRCWLLNVIPPFLRISSPGGIAWLTVPAIEYASIESVDQLAGQTAEGLPWQ